MSDLERFWAKTRRSGSCITWIAGKAKNGYGLFSLRNPRGSKRRHRTIYAHRFIYEQTFGLIPPKLDVMHSCDNRACVKIKHLSLGTRKENMTDAVQKERMSRGENRPLAKLTPKLIAEAKKRYATGESQASIAADFGVHQVTVGKAILGRTWRHVK